jgi:hypothetical protein
LRTAAPSGFARNWTRRDWYDGAVRRLLVLVPFVPFVLGCAYDAKGQGVEGSSSGPGDDDTTSIGAGTASTSGSTASLDGSSTSTGNDGSTGSSSGSEPETGSSGGPPLPMLGSCKEILEYAPDAPSGPYVIVRARDGAYFEVYCDMELDGGGWTLVGRSEDGAEVPFGWGVPQGVFGDDRAAYSLDVVALGLTFGEILIARRTGFATPVDNAYVVTVLPGFLGDYANDDYEHPGVRTVLGNCEPNPAVTMLRRVGYTANDRNFFLRDQPQNHPYGLFSNGFRMWYNDCSLGGDLNDEQGAVFVR